MKKLFPVVMLAMLMALAGCCSHSGAKNPAMPVAAVPAVEELMQESVALVTKNDEGDEVPYCTGVWVDETHVLTAEHCVRAMLMRGDTIDEDLKQRIALGEDEALKQLPELESKITMSYITNHECTGVHCPPKRVHDANPMKSDVAHDLALLKVEDFARPEHPVAKLAASTPLVGEDLHFVGHMIGLYWSYTKGVVAAYRETEFWFNDDRKGPWLQVSAAVYKGNSGGGAFNSAGELVGIASFMVRAPNTVFYVHLDSIKHFLDR